MPQMAPMNWMMLYFMFILLFISINFLNYYIFLIKAPLHGAKSNLLTKFMTWKW